MNPIQITFRGMSVSEALSEHIEAAYERLARFDDRLQSAHCVVEQAHRHQAKGRHFQVHLTLHIPGRELVVSRDPEERETREDAHEAVDEAFTAAERMLKEHAAQRRTRAAGSLGSLPEAD